MRWNNLLSSLQITLVSNQPLLRAPLTLIHYLRDKMYLQRFVARLVLWALSQEPLLVDVDKTLVEVLL